MLRVVEELSRNSIQSVGMTGGVVVIESDIGPPFQSAFDELDGLEAKQLAKAWAASHGVHDAQLTGTPGQPYSVGRTGFSAGDIDPETKTQIQMNDIRAEPYRFRVNINVTRGLA